MITLPGHFITLTVQLMENGAIRLIKQATSRDCMSCNTLCFDSSCSSSSSIGQTVGLGPFPATRWPTTVCAPLSIIHGIDDCNQLTWPFGDFLP